MQDAKENLAVMMASSKKQWWQYHHIKDEEAVKYSMAKELQALFKIFGFALSHETAREIVEPHVQAAMLHDKAEEFGDEGKTDKQAVYLGKVYELLLQYSKNLINEIDKQKNM
jgi:hypothetical protein